MRFFVALCLAWLAALTPARPTVGGSSGSASIREVASEHASPMLRAIGPQLASLAESSAPARAATTRRTATSRLHTPAPLPFEGPQRGARPASTVAMLRVHPQTHRLAAHGAFAPHFATAPPLQS